MGTRPELRVRAPTLKSWVWQHIPITPGLRMWRQEDLGVCSPVNELQGQWESLSRNKMENDRGRYLVLASGFTLHVLPHACTHMNIHAHEKTEGDRHSRTLLPFRPLLILFSLFFFIFSLFSWLLLAFGGDDRKHHAWRTLHGRCNATLLYLILHWELMK